MNVASRLPSFLPPLFTLRELKLFQQQSLYFLFCGSKREAHWKNVLLGLVQFSLAITDFPAGDKPETFPHVLHSFLSYIYTVYIFTHSTSPCVISPSSFLSTTLLTIYPRLFTSQPTRDYSFPSTFLNFPLTLNASYPINNLFILEKISCLV